ncbi:hypothetical protein [Streptomyces sp. NPDC005538]|uniref:hypothetical protein n=1 Tax=unclassified Streptomyces TaxID=2593676 RepID=UPI0033B42D02
MSIDSDPYARIMAQLQHELGDLAGQLDQEVRQGRTVSEQKLKQEGRFEARASRLAETELPPLGKTDVAVIPYTGDERIELIRGALLTLAETMYASRKAALDTAVDQGMNLNIAFGDPELETLSFLDLRVETDRAHVALKTVRELLSEEIEPSTESIR